MRKLSIIVALAMAMSVMAASIALAHGPTCSDFDALDVEVHGQHVTRDYVRAEGATNAKGGAVLPGGPGPGFHFPNGFAPGASFCNPNSQSPGFHVPAD